MNEEASCRITMIRTIKRATRSIIHDSRCHEQLAHGLPTFKILAQSLIVFFASIALRRLTLCALATSFRGYVS